MGWYKPSDRPMPWKEIDNPYFIWLSEIILQQTRVEQGKDYYLKFVEKYPTVFDLAKAPEDELMKMWEGLGYYSRARNLHAAAKHIAFELDGKFPETYEGILSLKGVGPYTAAAIGSFAFGLPYAVLDGNVYRVLSRYYGIETPTDSTEGKKEIAGIAESVLDKERPGKFNQAIMDFGATVCKPKGALCETACTMRQKCLAFKEKRVYEFPVRKKKLKKTLRFFHFFILEDNGSVFIRKRTEKDIWQNLYDFPSLETEKETDFTALEKSDAFKELVGGDYNIKTHSQSYKQELTHRTVIARFHELEVSSNFAGNDNWTKVERKEIRNFAFPKIIDRYLNDKSLYLKLF